MLTRKGIDLTRAVTALTITGMLTTIAGLLLFPVLVFVRGGDGVGIDSASALRFGVIALAVCVPLLVLVLRSDRPMRAIARACHAALPRLPRCRPADGLSARIAEGRDG